MCPVWSCERGWQLVLEECGGWQLVPGEELRARLAAAYLASCQSRKGGCQPRISQRKLLATHLAKEIASHASREGNCEPRISTGPVENGQPGLGTGYPASTSPAAEAAEAAAAAAAANSARRGAERS